MQDRELRIFAYLEKLNWTWENFQEMEEWINQQDNLTPIQRNHAARTKLQFKFWAAMHEAGIKDEWEAQEKVSIEDLRNLLCITCSNCGMELSPTAIPKQFRCDNPACDNFKCERR